MGANTSYPDSRLGCSWYPEWRGIASPDVAVPSPSVPRTQAPISSAIDRKKKNAASRLATLRRKLIRARRQSRCMDHGKALRELTSGWTLRELSALVDEYESLATLKELSLLASLARPHAHSVRDDLAALYDSGACSDVILLYSGARFPAHRAILAARCGMFRELLARYPQRGATVPVQLRTPGVDLTLFTALLRLLYSGSLEAGLPDTYAPQLDELAIECGFPNPLEQDLRLLLTSGCYADTVLVFGEPRQPSCGACERSCRHELTCHAALLAARSSFFRSLLERRMRIENQPVTRIVLDEKVLSPRYARLLVQALYLDVVDVALVETNSQQANSTSQLSSLNQVQAMVAGTRTTCPSSCQHLDLLLDVYQIAQFLDVPALAQGCEDALVESLTPDNLLSILSWSGEDHGSSWVHRQALHFLREEFLAVVQSQCFPKLPMRYLLQVIRSDFTQSGELDILSALIRWGEHHLRTSQESSGVASSSGNRKKRNEAEDASLASVIKNLIKYCRLQHLIPRSHDVVSSAVKRGLIPQLAATGADSWISGVRPRLFSPYHEEARSLLEESLAAQPDTELVRLRTVQQLSSDLPMTVARKRPQGDAVNGVGSSILVPVPDDTTLKALYARECALRHSAITQRAERLPRADESAIELEVQLRVVREFGLPDCAVELFRTSPCLHKPIAPPRGQSSRTVRPTRTPSEPPPCRPPAIMPEFTSVADDLSSCKNQGTVSPVSPLKPTCLRHMKHTTYQQMTHLSDPMPDVALATESMTLYDCDLDLDLGDGMTTGLGCGRDRRMQAGTMYM